MHDVGRRAGAHHAVDTDAVAVVGDVHVSPGERGGGVHVTGVGPVQPDVGVIAPDDQRAGRHRAVRGQHRRGVEVRVAAALRGSHPASSRQVPVLPVGEVAVHPPVGLDGQRVGAATLLALEPGHRDVGDMQLGGGGGGDLERRRPERSDVVEAAGRQAAEQVGGRVGEGGDADQGGGTDVRLREGHPHALLGPLLRGVGDHLGVDVGEVDGVAGDALRVEVQRGVATRLVVEQPAVTGDDLALDGHGVEAPGNLRAEVPALRLGVHQVDRPGHVARAEPTRLDATTVGGPGVQQHELLEVHGCVEATFHAHHSPCRRLSGQRQSNPRSRRSRAADTPCSRSMVGV